MQFINYTRPKTRAVHNRFAGDYDKFTLIDNRLYDYIRAFNDYSPEIAQSELSSILSEMLTMVSKYYKEKDIRDCYYSDINTETKQETQYSLFEFCEIVNITLDKVLLKRIYELAFREYNLLARNMGDAIPTYTRNFRKSVFLRLYREVPDAKYDQFLADFEVKRNIAHLRRTKENWCVYCISRGYEFDMDFPIGIIGKKRISKSMFAKRFVERFYRFRLGKTHDEIHTFLKLYDYLTKFYVFKAKTLEYVSIIAEILWHDELMASGGERRGAMTRENRELTKNKKTEANANTVDLMIIQNYSDADSRIVDDVVMVFQVLERGHIYVHVDWKPFAVTKIRPFQKFEDNPDLLSEPVQGKYNLRNSKSYLGQFYYKNEKCEFWWDYKKFKQKEQGFVMPTLLQNENVIA